MGWKRDTAKRRTSSTYFFINKFDLFGVLSAQHPSVFHFPYRPCFETPLVPLSNFVVHRIQCSETISEGSYSFRADTFLKFLYVTPSRSILNTMSWFSEFFASIESSKSFRRAPITLFLFTGHHLSRISRWRLRLYFSLQSIRTTRVYLILQTSSLKHHSVM